MEQQSKWMKTGEDHAMVKDFIYRSEYDHPNSLHNVTTNQSDRMQARFPKTSMLPDGGNAASKAKMSLNGFYEKEALTLKNGFKEPKNQHL